MALASGAVAIGLSRTEKKRERLTRLGLEHVFDPGRTDLADAVRAAADRDGVDVVLDLVGAAAWASNLDVMRTRGRLVVVGLLGGARVDLDLWTLLRKRLTLVGTVLRSRSLDEKIELTRAFARRMGPLLNDGRLEPTVDRSFPLEHAAEAHALMESNANFGKIVLEVSPT